MERDGDFREKLEEILSFANKNDNSILYNMVVDLLKSRDDSLEDKELSEALEYLKSQGVQIIPPEDEDYPADEIAPAMILLACGLFSRQSAGLFSCRVNRHLGICCCVNRRFISPISGTPPISIIGSIITS